MGLVGEIEGSPYFFYDNPLINPLLIYHTRFSHSFDILPSEGKICELAIRIGCIVVAPLAYFALSLAAGIGFLIHPFLEYFHNTFQKETKCSDSSVRLLVKENLKAAKKGFMRLWRCFEGDLRPFNLWNPRAGEESLKSQFEQMRIGRLGVYFVNADECIHRNAIGHYKDVFQIPENWKSWGSRYPYPLAFSFNLALPSYDASIITLNGVRFLAMEAPTESNVRRFKRIISDYKVTHLVRLTPSFDGDVESCYPYWNEGQRGLPADSGSILEIGDRAVYSFSKESWVREDVMKPKELLALVKGVMNRGASESVIAVHCRGGCGRTGTFLAAYALIHDIDRQISAGVGIDQLEIGIEEIFWKLTLQRPFCVAVNFSQFLALHRLVRYYIESL